MISPITSKEMALEAMYQVSAQLQSRQATETNELLVAAIKWLAAATVEPTE